MAYLLVGEQVFLLDRQSEYTIGRHEACDIAVDGLFVSRKHATLKKIGNVYIIIDDGSRNGTFIGGQRIDFQSLKNGTRIEIGRVGCLFQEGTPEHMQTGFGTISGAETPQIESINPSNCYASEKAVAERAARRVVDQSQKVAATK